MSTGIDGAPPSGGDQAGYRYGVVLLLVIVLVAFAIVAPPGDVSRAVGFAIEALALLAVAATSRARIDIRRTYALAVIAGGTAVALLTATGVVSATFTFAADGLLAAAIPVTLIGGLVRLLRSRGVTAQAVAGALALYLLLGLLFAWVVGLIAHVQATPYFAGGNAVDSSNAVYYSFTTMTTTGFGDLTAATRVGHALAVLEMLLGQIYVVVIIGLLVSNVTGRPRARSG